MLSGGRRPTAQPGWGRFQTSSQWSAPPSHPWSSPMSWRGAEEKRVGVSLWRPHLTTRPVMCKHCPSISHLQWLILPLFSFCLPQTWESLLPPHKQKPSLRQGDGRTSWLNPRLESFWYLINKYQHLLNHYDQHTPCWSQMKRKINLKTTKKLYIYKNKIINRNYVYAKKNRNQQEKVEYPV